MPFTLCFPAFGDSPKWFVFNTGHVKGLSEEEYAKVIFTDVVSIEAAQAMGLKTAEEAFADRRYESDGTLTPRSQAGACFTEVQDVLIQVQKIKADTWCIHGDGPHALDFAKALKENR